MREGENDYYDAGYLAGQEDAAARIAALEALVKELADTLETYVCAKYVGKNGCPTAKRGEYDDAVEPIRKARMAIAVNNQLKVDSSLSAEAKKDDEPMSNEDWERTAFTREGSQVQSLCRPPFFKYLRNT